MKVLKELRINKGISQTELGNAVGLTRSSICQYERGARQPDGEILRKFADFFDVSVDYLLERDIKCNIVMQDVSEVNDVNAIPLLGRVVAGIPLESEENFEGYVFTSFKPKEEYFALRVHGDSMIDAGMKDNSIVVVHKQSWANNGDIIVAIINGEHTVKRFKVYGESVFLVPENRSYEPIIINKGTQFIVLGKVVEIRIAI